MNKPHYKWKEAFAVANEITKPEDVSVPDWLRERSKDSSFGNIDASDLNPPRLKMLAGMSPEVMSGVPNAMPGHFWLTILNQNLGQMITGTPIKLRKTFVIWAPRVPGSDQKGPLAIASDGIHWDQPNQTFEVRFYGNPKVYRWETKRTVLESGLHLFGSSQPEDRRSKPAATLTYDVLWLVDLPEGGKIPCVLTSARTGVTNTKNFISTTQTLAQTQKLATHFQRYEIKAEKRSGPTGDPYYSYNYRFIGRVQTEAEADETQALFDQYTKSGFVADFENEAEDIRSEQGAQDSPRGFAPAKEADDEIPF